MTRSTAARPDGPARTSDAALGSDADPADRTSPRTDPGSGAPREEAARPPGLREQLGRTKGAVGRLLGSHVELAKSELADILDEVKRAAMFGGLAVAVLVLLGLLLVVGGMLFLGEAIFGSIGWGVLHGTLLLAAVAVILVLVALRFPAGPLVRSLLVAAVVGAIVAVVLGLDLTNRGWTALGNAVAGPIAPDIRPLAVGAGVMAILGAVVGLILGARGGGAGGAIGGLVGGAVIGALVGALTAIALGPRVGAAIGVTVALLVWLALIGRQVARRGIDADSLKARFWPQETIDTTKETIEWVREQAPLGPKS